MGCGTSKEVVNNNNNIVNNNDDKQLNKTNIDNGANMYDNNNDEYNVYINNATNKLDRQISKHGYLEYDYYINNNNNDEKLDDIENYVECGNILDPNTIIIDHSSYLGGGAFGRVYKGTWKDKITVAIKIIDIQAAEEKFGLNRNQVMRNLFWEANNLASISHSSIVGLYGVTIEPPQLIMEYVHHNLIDVLTNISTTTKIHMLAELSDGLIYLHGNGIVHRDIKDENVLVDENMHAKFADLGVSQKDNLITSLESKLADHNIKDKRWASPEECNGLLGTTASDIFAFGLLAWRMFNETINVWSNCEKKNIVNAISNNQISEHHKFHSSMPEELCKLIKKCWSLDPSNRPSGKEISQILWNFIGNNNPSILIRRRQRELIHQYQDELNSYEAPYCTIRDVTASEWRSASKSKKKLIDSMIVTDVIKNFIIDDDTHRLLLLLGDGGIGKTLTLLNTLLLDKNNDDSKFLVIPLRSALQEWSHQSLINGVSKALCDNEYFNSLKANDILALHDQYTCIYLIDGYDELILDTSPMNDLLKVLGIKDNNNSKVIVTCRKNIVPNNLIYERFGSTSIVYYMQPFTYKQLNTYLSREASQEVSKIIDNNDNLKNLLSNGFLLRLFVNSFVDIRNEHNDLSLIKRRHIYQAFIKHWIISKHNYLTPSVRQKLCNHTSPQKLLEYFNTFAGQVAFQMFKNGSVSLSKNNVHDMNELWDELQLLVEQDARTLFTNRNENSGRSILNIKTFVSLKKRQLKLFFQSCVLQLRGSSQYSFIHKSVMEYFVANYFVNELLKVEKVFKDNVVKLDFCGELISQTPAVLQFTSEFVDILYDQHKISNSLTCKLWAIIDFTRHIHQNDFKEFESNRELRKAICIGGANAISILNISGLSFSNRDLSYGIFGFYKGFENDFGNNLKIFADLGGSIFSGCNLNHCVFNGCNLQSCNLDYVISIEFAQFNLVEWGIMPVLSNNLSKIHCICVDQNNEDIVYTGSFYGALQVWSLKEGKCIKNYGKIHHYRMVSLDISSTSNYLVSGDSNGIVVVWKLYPELKNIKYINAHQTSVSKILFDKQNPDHFYTCGRDKCLYKFDVKDAENIDEMKVVKPILSFEGHTHYLTALWVNDKQHLYSSSYKTIRKFDTQSGNLLMSLDTSSRINCFVCTKDERFLYSANNTGIITEWIFRDDINNYELNREFTSRLGDIRKILLNHDETSLYSTSKDNALCEFLLLSGEIINRRAGHSKEITDLALGHRGTIFSTSLDSTIRQWNVETPPVLRLKLLESQIHTSYVTCVDICNKNGYIITGSSDTTVRKWREYDGHLLLTVHNPYKNGIYRVFACETRDAFYFFDKIGNLCMVDANNGTLLYELQFKNSRSIGLSSDEKYLYVCDSVATLQQIDANNFSRYNCEFYIHSLPDAYYTLKSDPNILFCCSSNGISIINVKQQNIQQFAVTENNCRCLTISHDEQTIVAAYRFKKTLHIFNMKNVEENRIINIECEAYSLTFSYDDQLLYCGGAKGGIYVYNIMNDECLMQINGIIKCIYEMVPSKVYNQSLYVVSQDHTIRCLTKKGTWKWINGPRFVSAINCQWNSCEIDEISKNILQSLTDIRY